VYKICGGVTAAPILHTKRTVLHPSPCLCNLWCSTSEKTYNTGYSTPDRKPAARFMIGV